MNKRKILNTYLPMGLGIIVLASVLSSIHLVKEKRKAELYATTFQYVQTSDPIEKGALEPVIRQKFSAIGLAMDASASGDSVAQFLMDADSCGTWAEGALSAKSSWWIYQPDIYDEDDHFASFEKAWEYCMGDPSMAYN